MFSVNVSWLLLVWALWYFCFCRSKMSNFISIMCLASLIRYICVFLFHIAYSSILEHFLCAKTYSWSVFRHVSCYSSIFRTGKLFPKEWPGTYLTLFSFAKWWTDIDRFSTVQFSRSVVSNSLRPHELQHARSPCPSPAPGVHPNPCPLSQWCHPTISSSVIPFSPCPQSFPASGSFQMSHPNMGSSDRY